MNNIEVDECITNLRFLIQKNYNNPQLSEALRDNLVATYDMITRDNACQLYSDIQHLLSSEYSAIRNDFSWQMLKISMIPIMFGLTLIGGSSLINVIVRKNTSTRTLSPEKMKLVSGAGYVTLVLGLLILFSVGH
ncbi:Hypothetical protein HVR_LOCUS415 [uncultured virus]|nr:Hypothetical protein HVR_LOCUS415 [uncultured virus]